jgi:hypothetical protein
MAFSIAYNKVFDVSVWHDHFLAPGPADTFTPPPVSADAERLRPYESARFLSFHPSNEALKVLSDKGLIFKTNRYGCLVAKKASFAETNPAVKVTLLAKLRDPDFLNYTALGFDLTNRRKGKIVYLYNKGLVPDGAGRINLSRSGGNFVTIAQNLFDWQTRLVRLPQLVPGTNTTVQVFDATQAVPTLVMTIVANSGPDQPEYELDCRSLPAGLYRFEAPNLNTSTLYLGQESESGETLAVIDIFLASVSNVKFDIRFNHN